ncbi:unnamed protein product [Adineta steineri]|uniref:Cyclin-like domain-containing protein n=1 Tax=Adineta steineri TaxID=433720 RepID=A0A814MBT8_9BILA|nr:unnamed protein product [Adineta steineri]CAF1076794.1 unnamed protein product [Adineta steineri]CAF3766081.1 unnamed protein product [Adineta steineri]CAF4146127.1 unnamed protein product [Adineta steineri]
MGAVISYCCSCCDKTATKYNENLVTSHVTDKSPSSYENKYHVSDIYPISADDETAPSDNPNISTFFQSMLHPPEEANQSEIPSTSSQTKTNSDNLVSTLSDTSNNQKLNPNVPINSKQNRPPLLPSSSLSSARLANQNGTLRPSTANNLLKHSNSCSTIYVDDSTVSQPNWKAMIKCVSIAIHSHMLHRKSNKSMDIFDEKLHPLSKDLVPNDYDTQVPEQKLIYRFMRNLFTAAQLTAECAIVTLVYLERVLSYGELDLCPSNWKRLVLGAIMLASKVWDDQAVWNVDFCSILKDITVSDMNALEREYVQVLQFNVNVASSIYAKYYFDLRQIAKEHQISFPNELLTKEKAYKLEALSFINHNIEQTISDGIRTPNSSQLSTYPHLSTSQHRSLAPLLSLRRSASVEFAQSPRKSLLIIS